MIKYLTYQEIDRSKWDDCIASSFNGIVYAYSWYLDIVCPWWEALIENDYERVFPLTVRKKSGINYLFQPFFTQQLGVFSKSKLSEDIVEEFIRNIPDKYKFAEINLNTFNKLDESKFNIKPNLTHELDLIPSYDTIFRNYSDNIKRNIKQALNAGLSITKNIDIDQIINIFRQNKGTEIDTFKDNDYLTLKKLVNLCIYKKAAHVWGIETKEKKICAGAVFVESNRKVIFLFSATNAEAKSMGAMSFLIDSFIRENAQYNLTLDFEGSNDVNLARFYKSFGAKECIYHQYKKNDLNWILSKSVTFIKRLKKKFRI
ncbi:MAG: hypothetical protein ABR968_14045 [Bacteroidales bacterium]